MTDLSQLSREQLEALVAKMQASTPRKISFKVTAPKADPKSGEMKGSSGAISLYGLGRFPITLYASQWNALISAIPDLRKFMDTNRTLLSTKD